MKNATTAMAAIPTMTPTTIPAIAPPERPLEGVEVGVGVGVVEAGGCDGEDVDEDDVDVAAAANEVASKVYAVAVGFADDSEE